MRPLVWLRTDLRARDNTALRAAAARADRGVVAVYLLAPAMWGRHDEAGAKIDFILRSLRELSSTLRTRNIPLLIREAPGIDDASEALLAVAREHDCDALHFNRQHEVNEQRRDQQVADAFESASIEVRAHDDQTIFPPGSVLTKQGSYYSVFTPFKRAWLEAARDRDDLDPAGLPKKHSDLVCEPDAIPDSIDGFESAIDADRWPGGESGAQKRLASFCAGPISDYHEARDTMAIDGTSRLSPYLAQGVLSARQCLRAARDANAGRFTGGSPGAETWISELIWREFYKHMLEGSPRVSMGRAFKPETDALDWRKDEDEFERWTQGMTGFPIVDAGMRQLAATGWMHNRARMIVAMFLTKDLYIDWRWGERWFMRHLVDGDLAANNGGWQWSASTGADAQPYFRIFNPVRQSERYDPDGDYIRRWVPELAGVKGKAIHDPSRLEKAARARLEYPEPMVDHSAARDRVLEAFKRLKD
ncbi:MAG: deoxyribodipyrimidine photo-lyase [Phycisphaerales bacterium]